MPRFAAAIFMILVSASLGVGCGGESADPGAGGAGEAAEAGSPEAAVEGMLALAEKGLWRGYVATYYGEQHKMDKPDKQIDAVALRLGSMAPQLIEMLKGCVGQEPVLSEDGTVATWPNQFKLHKAGGQWGFHL